MFFRSANELPPKLSLVLVLDYLWCTVLVGFAVVGLMIVTLIMLHGVLERPEAVLVYDPPTVFDAWATIGFSAWWVAWSIKIVVMKWRVSRDI